MASSSSTLAMGVPVALIAGARPRTKVGRMAAELRARYLRVESTKTLRRRKGTIDGFVLQVVSRVEWR